MHSFHSDCTFGKCRKMTNSYLKKTTRCLQYALMGKEWVDWPNAILVEYSYLSRLVDMVASRWPPLRYIMIQNAFDVENAYIKKQAFVLSDLPRIFKGKLWCLRYNQKEDGAAPPIEPTRFDVGICGDLIWLLPKCMICRSGHRHLSIWSAFLSWRYKDNREFRSVFMDTALSLFICSYAYTP